MAGTGAGRKLLGCSGEWLGGRYSDATQGQRYISHVSNEDIDSYNKYKLHSFNFGARPDHDRLPDKDVHCAVIKYLRDHFSQTEMGQWIYENGIKTTFEINYDIAAMLHKVVLIGDLSPEDATYYKLRWS